MKFVCLKLYMFEPCIVNFVQSLLPVRPCYSCKALVCSEVDFLRIFVDTAGKNEVIDQHSSARKVSEAVLNCRRQEEPAILILRLLLCMLHVCSRQSFGLPLRMNRMHRMQFDHSFTHNLIRLVFIICHVKLMQSAVMEKSVLTFDHCHLHSVSFAYY